MKREYLYKVYRRGRTTLSQRVYDGNFEGYDNDVFANYWSAVGTPDIYGRSRNDAYPDATLGKSIALDGSSAYIDLPSVAIGGGFNDAIYTYSTFTMSLWWYKPNWNTAGQEYLVDHRPGVSGGGINGDGWSLDMNATTAGKLTVSVSLSNTFRRTDYSLSSIAPGLHHIAFGSDGQYVRLWVDGVLVNTYTHGSNVGIADGFSGDVEVRLGATNLAPSKYATGQVDSAGLYGTFLATTDVKRLAKTRNADSANILYNFDMDEGVGMRLTNSLDTGYTEPLPGDLNLDGTVDGLDISTLLGNWGPAPKTPAQGDITGDGAIDDDDFTILLANFGRTQPAPQQPAVAYGSITWLDGYATLYRSAMVTTSTSGSTEQGLQQATGKECIVSPLKQYTAAAWVKAASGQTIKMTLTPSGGGSASSVSIPANGSWQQIVSTYTTAAGATKLAIKIVLTNANALATTLYVDRVALNDGAIAYDYFDQTTQGVGTTAVTFDDATQSHTVTTNTYAFIDTWIDAASDFSHPQEMNNAGSDVQVRLARRSGSYGEGYDVDYNLEVRIYLIDDNNVNGNLRFTGYISDYTINETDQLVDVIIFGYGADLSNYTLQGGDSTEALMPLAGGAVATGGSWSGLWYNQIILPTKRTPVDRLRLMFSIPSGSSQSFRIALYRGDPTLNTLVVTGGTPSYDTHPSNTFIAASLTDVTISGPTPKTYEVEFDEVILQAGVQYYVDYVINDVGWFGTASAYGSQAGDLPAVDGYAPIGRAYSAVASFNNAGFAMELRPDQPQLYLEIISANGTSTKVSFDDMDVGLMVRKGMDDLSKQGGNLTYDADSIPLFNWVVSYDFNTVTHADFLDKCLELAPVGTYYFIDHSTNKVHFKRRTETPVHIFVLGEHLQGLIFEKRSRDVVNVIMFTGGEISPGVNLFKVYENQASIAKYGRRLQVYVDNRVTKESTADTIAQGILDEHSDAELRTSPVIINYDLETLYPGDVVTFRAGDGDPAKLALWDVGQWDNMYWDYGPTSPETLALQIARIYYYPDHAEITLSTTPPDVNKRIEDINRNLEKQQTINNPDEPTYSTE